MRLSNITKIFRLTKPFEVKALFFMSTVQEIVLETSKKKGKVNVDQKLFYFCNAIIACQFAAQ